MMRHMTRVFIYLLIIIVGLSIASPHAFADTAGSTLTVDYQLGADKEGRSTLKTTEKINTVSAGLLAWTMLKDFDGHPLALHITSVTDGNNAPLPYMTEDNADSTTINIDSNTAHMYIITYTQRDVTKYVASAKDDEFAWQVLGTDWPETFGHVTATIHLSDSISPTFTKNVACLQGTTNQCTVSTDGKTITLTALSVAPHESVVLTAGFTPGTFRGYIASSPSLMHYILAGSAAIAVFVISVITVKSLRLRVSTARKKS